MKKLIGILIMTLLIGTGLISAMSIDDFSLDDNLFISNSSDVEWVKAYGEDRFEMLQCVQTTNDGGYIACGVKSAYDFGDGFFRPWVIKTDSNGELEWEWEFTEVNTYEGYYFSYFADCYCMFIHEINDGGYITGFRIQCGTGEGDEYWIGGLVKLDESGDEVWVKYCMDGLDWVLSPYSIIEFNDGSFLVVGMSGALEVSNSEYDACIYKINANGDEQWRREYNYGVGDFAFAECVTNDNGYLLTGWADDNGNIDFWMIKTDLNGNMIWEKTHGGDSADYGHARNCYQTNDNGYIMSGYTNSFGEGGIDAWIVKTDSTGNMIWNRTYGTTRTDSCWSFESNDDDSYVFCVTINLGGFSGTRDDIHIVKTDNEGHIVWIQKYEDEGRHVGQHICKTEDGGFIVSGRNGRYFNDDSDGILVKFAPFSNERPNKPDAPDGPSRGKPDTEYTFSTTAVTDSDGDTVLYKWDWGDGNFSELLDNTETTYAWTFEDNFEVRVMAIDENGGESDWSDPLAFSTPKNKNIDQYPIIIQKILERFPFLKSLMD